MNKHHFLVGNAARLVQSSRWNQSEEISIVYCSTFGIANSLRSRVLSAKLQSNLSVCLIASATHPILTITRRNMVRYALFAQMIPFPYYSQATCTLPWSFYGKGKTQQEAFADLLWVVVWL
ncbi:MAG TPA: hypothetical protein ENK32_00420 [Anaerolineae bacterium]|nr:hypothetical protein [Anaerolineae bacterium]